MYSLHAHRLIKKYKNETALCADKTRSCVHTNCNLLPEKMMFSCYCAVAVPLISKQIDNYLDRFVRAENPFFGLHTKQPTLKVLNLFFRKYYTIMDTVVVCCARLALYSATTDNSARHNNRGTSLLAKVVLGEMVPRLAARKSFQDRQRVTHVNCFLKSTPHFPCLSLCPIRADVSVLCGGGGRRRITTVRSLLPTPQPHFPNLMPLS